MDPKCKFDSIILESSNEQIVDLFNQCNLEDAKLVLNTCLHYNYFDVLPGIIIKDHFYTTELFRLAPLKIFIEANMPLCPENHSRDYILTLARTNIDLTSKIQYIKQKFIESRIDYVSMMIDIISDDSHKFKKSEYIRRMINIFNIMTSPDERMVIINSLGAEFIEIIKHCIKYLTFNEKISLIKSAVNTKKYLPFAVILNHTSQTMKHNDIVDIYYYTISFGTEHMLAKLQKLFTLDTLNKIFSDREECSNILNKIAERGSVVMFKNITTYWTELENRFMNLDIITSNAAYNGKIEFLEFIEKKYVKDYYRKRFLSIILKKGIKAQNRDALLFVYKHDPVLFLNAAPTEFIKNNVVSMALNTL